MVTAVCHTSCSSFYEVLGGSTGRAQGVACSSTAITERVATRALIGSRAVVLGTAGRTRRGTRASAGQTGLVALGTSSWSGILVVASGTGRFASGGGGMEVVAIQAERAVGDSSACAGFAIRSTG